ncbi:hypothetical protein B0I37DRAFT_443628 [Chaetomium sp. MPI-CAGE-AT-0009]|nr:hypothetical protein B0I37DRAFT_443628 [Chaetomium sp. MPI-CAGE-AT-0009]
MSAVVGEWTGYFAYPDGSRKDLSLKIDQTANNTVFIGTGNEPSGEFNVVAGQVTSADGGSTVTFAQIYKSIWAGQIWSFRGTLSPDGNTLSGEWYDSPADGRNRIGTWNVQRGPVSPLTGKWSGTFSYPDGSHKSITLDIPAFTVGALFKGKGNDGAVFSVEGTGVANVKAAKGGFSWIQTYDSQWHGQVWFWDGVLSENGNELKGNWHDSAVDGRQRSAGFHLTRA